MAEAVELKKGTLDKEVVSLKIADLKLYPSNPRIGNIGAIADSLEANGQFRPIIVQKSTNYVLMGNHTMQAMAHLKRKTILGILADVDDDLAKRWVLADNRTSDLGSYDSEALSELLGSLELPEVGTGYTVSEVLAIQAAVAEKDAELINRVIHESAPQIQFPEAGNEMTLSDRVSGADARAREMLGDDYIAAQQDEAALRGELTEDQQMADLESFCMNKIKRQYEVTNYWGVPSLRTDMLIDTLPSKIDTWAGDDASVDDGESTYMFIWGNGTRKNLPWDRAILSFFTHDEKWQSWIDNPHIYIAKMLAKKLKMAVSPDCSMWVDDVKFFQLQSHFEEMWVARSMQECGIRVAPRIAVCDLASVKIGVLGVPIGTPVVVLNQQFDAEAAVNADAHTALRLYIDEIKPEAMLVYGGPPAQKFVEEAHLPKQLHVQYTPNYVAQRRGKVFDKGAPKKSKTSTVASDDGGVPPT